MPIDDYADFDLLILPTDNGYQARVTQSPVGQATNTFTLPFAQDELRRFFWVAGVALRKLRLVAETPPAPLTPQQFGQRLFDAVFAGQVGQCFVRSLDAAERDAKGLRLRLHLNDAPELASLPWEYLFATSPKPGFLALADATPIVRYLELQQEEEALKVLPPLRILAVVSNPQDVTPLDVEKEWTRLHDALADLQSRQLVSLERLDPPTPGALQHRLRNQEAGAVHMLHFIGHGAYDEERKLGGLYFENADRQHHFLAAADLAILLQDHAALRLLFLNACEGARGGQENLFAGAAQTLVQQGLPAVLAMQFPVGDAAAIALSHEFYQALAQGLPVDACVGAARKAIKLSGNDLEWGTPVLFSRSSDGRVLVLPEGDARPLIASKIPQEPETVLVPGGAFLLGSAPAAGIPDDETPAHQVDLPDFRIGRTPVTHGEYAVFLQQTSSQEPPRGGWFNRQPPPGTAAQPVGGVTWYDAAAYCRWLSAQTGRRYRLPSEAEWEKAARTGRAEAIGAVQEWTQTVWGSEAGKPAFGYPYVASDGREADRRDSREVRIFRVYRGWRGADSPEDARLTRRRASEARSALAWRGFRVVMALA
jgi:formylglycine-generating enzyme required for sulfatase activity